MSDREQGLRQWVEAEGKRALERLLEALDTERDLAAVEIECARFRATAREIAERIEGRIAVAQKARAALGGFQPDEGAPMERWA